VNCHTTVLRYLGLETLDIVAAQRAVQPQDDTLTSIRPRPPINFDFSNVETDYALSRFVPELYRNQSGAFDFFGASTLFAARDTHRILETQLSCTQPLISFLPTYDQMKHSGVEGGKSQPSNRYGTRFSLALSNTPTHLTDTSPTYSFDPTSLSVQQMWESAVDTGRGPRWAKDAQLEPGLSNQTPPRLENIDFLRKDTTFYNYVSTSDRKALVQTYMLHLKNRVVPETESNVVIPMKSEDDSSVDIVRDLVPGIGLSSWISSRQNHVPLQLRCTSQDVDSSVGSEMGISSEDELKNGSSPEPRAFAPSRDALLPNMQRSASYHSDASTDHSILESEVSISAEEENESFVLGTQRRRIVDRVMSHFYAIFQAMPAVSHRGHEESQSGSSQTAANYSTTTSSSTSDFVSSSNTKLGKHARQKNDEDHSDEESGQPPKRPKKETMTTITPEAPKRKFACPYFKRDSEKYLTRRSCVGPGWDKVRRVK
jgi:hypothetical protein